MPFLESVSNMWGNVYNVLFYAWPFVLLVALFILRRRWKAYPLEAIIIEKRIDNLVKTNDRIGKMEDKSTGMSSYRFSKSKETIPVLNYEFILHNKNKNTNFLEKIINLIRTNEGTVFLFKYGSKQYKPITISLKKGGEKQKLVPVKDKKGNLIYTYRYEQFDPRYILGVLDFDVIDWDNMNFMVQEQRASVERRTKKKDRLMQVIIPITIIAASLIIGIFIIKFSSDTGQSLATGGGGSSNGGGGGKILGALGDTLTPGQ